MLEVRWDDPNLGRCVQTSTYRMEDFQRRQIFRNEPLQRLPKATSWLYRNVSRPSEPELATFNGELTDSVGKQVGNRVSQRPVQGLSLTA